MKDMGEQLEDMSSELSKLRVENNSLKNRNTILEKVLALRDEHIRMLQDEQQVRRGRGAACFAPALCTAVHCRLPDSAAALCTVGGWSVR